MSGLGLSWRQVETNKSAFFAAEKLPLAAWRRHGHRTGGAGDEAAGGVEICLLGAVLAAAREGILLLGEGTVPPGAQGGDGAGGC